jgi:hypothetical protein
VNGVINAPATQVEGADLHEIHGGPINDSIEITCFNDPFNIYVVLPLLIIGLLKTSK